MVRCIFSLPITELYPDSEMAVIREPLCIRANMI
jgi:hypothetical protein